MCTGRIKGILFSLVVRKEQLVLRVVFLYFFNILTSSHGHLSQAYSTLYAVVVLCALRLLFYFIFLFPLQTTPQPCHYHSNPLSNQSPNIHYGFHTPRIGGCNALLSVHFAKEWIMQLLDLVAENVFTVYFDTRSVAAVESRWLFGQMSPDIARISG